MSAPNPDTHQKAFRINRDPNKYGTFAEIGAGQEVARWFFRVGGAAGTVAKTMSAYDMAFSDAIYGSSKRYVSRERLAAMLDHEYRLLEERLREKRGASAQFFVFANTVAAASYTRRGIGNGWLGIRFLLQPQAEPSEIIIHARLLERENLQQQEALGILGVNLIYGAFHLHHDPGFLLGSLLDGLGEDRIEVDMVRFSGLGFEEVDNRLMALQLVKRGLTPAAMFTAEGEAVQPAEILYKKNVLVERGSFRPVTKATLDMLACAQRAFAKEPDVEQDQTIVLAEMTLRHLIEGGEVNDEDFLHRVDILGALGKTVLISNYIRYFRLATYLAHYTKGKIGLVMGVPSLEGIFEKKFYEDLEGGLLESFGRLFKNNLKLYIYPFKDPESGEVVTAESFRVAPNLRPLYAYLIENHLIEDLRGFNESYLPFFPREVMAMIKDGDSTWEEMVPPQVVDMIKKRKLYSDPPS